jgi:pilus assembly protein Flp/PilA
MMILDLPRRAVDARRLLRCREGATAIEYALIAGGIALVIIAAVFSVGEAVEASFQGVVDAFNSL